MSSAWTHSFRRLLVIKSHHVPYSLFQKSKDPALLSKWNDDIHYDVGVPSATGSRSPQRPATYTLWDNNSISLFLLEW